jgi:hypothetical protein
MSKLDSLIAWRKNPERKFNDGVELIKDKDSKYTTFFRANEKAKKGEMAFNMLDARVERQIRLLSQSDPKKKSETETKLTEPTLSQLAETAQKAADEALEASDKETDPKAKKELEKQAEKAMKIAEEAIKRAEKDSK